MTPPFEVVFGRSRQDMSSGPYAVVIREAAAPGERRRYTKQFQATPEGDFRRWTAREARILQRLGRHGLRCVPELAASSGVAEAVQTFDAGVSVEQWATLLRVERDSRLLPHLFADCAHWWALAHHTLRALETLHLLEVVHLDLNPGNLCIPALHAGPAPPAPGATIGLQFARLSLIDFALSLAPPEAFAWPFPIGDKPRYAYRSPRLLEACAAARAGELRAMDALDWRCDLYSFAAMLREYLVASTSPSAHERGWTDARRASALALLAAVDQAHEREIGAVWPHQALIEACETEMGDPDLVASLMQGFTLAPAAVSAVPVTPSAPIAAVQPAPANARDATVAPSSLPTPIAPARSRWGRAGATALVLLLGAGAAAVYWRDRLPFPPLVARWDNASTLAPTAPPGPSSSTDSTSAERHGSQIPTDVATVQRAASDEPRDSAKTQAVETPPRASPVPQATPPPPVSPPAPAAPRPAAPAPPPTSAQANTALPSRAVEEVAARVEPDAARVLALAARTAGPDADARIRQGARAMRNVTNRPRPLAQSSTVGRQLNAQARAAWERQDVDAALRLQQRAFDAYPNDPEIAGNLAFYYLKVKPAQPGAARRLALYALGVRGNAFPAGRMQDWGTLAVASSLDGRKADATGALFVMLATSGSPERACRAALLAVAQYGPPMQSPANALLSRVRARGAATGAPSCR